jgi:TonB family protein
VSTGTARRTGSNDESPWRLFLVVSIGVHVAAVALVAIVVALFGAPARPTWDARGSRRVDLAYLARVDAVAPDPPVEILEVPGSLQSGPNPVSSVPLSTTGMAPPSSPERVPPSTQLSTRGTAPAGFRTATGSPARTIVISTMPSGELTAGNPTGSPAADPPRGEAGTDPGAARPPDLVFGPPGSPLVVSLGSLDPRFADYLGAIAALLEPEWRNAFPRDRAMFMQQGEIVIEWTVERDGAVGQPRIVRPSGVPPFDRNVLAGFRRAAARFPPPPSTMPLPMRIQAPYRFANPMFD